MNIKLKEAVANIENKFDLKFEYRDAQYYNYLSLPVRYGVDYEEYSLSVFGMGEWHEISLCSSINEGMVYFIYGLNQEEIPNEYIEESFSDAIEIFEAFGVLRGFKLKQLLESFN
jgi:hypothetical protein